jgi:O-antigen ligase
MRNLLAEKTVANLLAIGGAFATIFIVTSAVTDPVNVTKMWVTGGLAISVTAVMLGFFGREVFSNFKILLFILMAFFLSTLNAVIQSDSPILQNIYGAYGRNTGLVSYLFLCLITVSALVVRAKNNFRKIILGLLVAGAVNVIYCAWVIAFGDFLPWNNPYGNILGLFGNPNFIGSFLGIFCSVVAALALGKEMTRWQKSVCLLFFLVAAYEIKESQAIQGIVVTASGLAVVGFFYLRGRLKSLGLLFGYVTAIGLLGFVSLLGALQKGPFDFIYKRSVSLRGAYWDAGFSMGSAHPFSGVGMDSYGDWYRRARSLEAVTDTPGLATVTNAAHNVVIDFFAYGGYPLLLSYLALLIYGAVSMLRVIWRNGVYDPIFVSISVGWVCYHLQSIISINQIGLAIWGWLLTGLLIAYEYSTRGEQSEKVSGIVKNQGVQNRRNVSTITPNLLGFIGLVVGLFIAAPPLNADIKWRSALESQDARVVLASLNSSWFNPVNSQQLNQGVQLFMQNNLTKEAREIALKSVEFNPDSYDAWRMFYFLPDTSEEERFEAKMNMQRLDPLNPDVTKP